jgi:hypothetical protein
MSALQFAAGNKTFFFFPRRSAERHPTELDLLEPGIWEHWVAGVRLPSGAAGERARKAGRGGRCDTCPQEQTVLKPRLESWAPAVQPTPQFLSCPQTTDSPPLTLTPTLGRVSDSAPGPLRTKAEAEEKAARTPYLGVPSKLPD